MVKKVPANMLAGAVVKGLNTAGSHTGKNLFVYVLLSTKGHLSYSVQHLATYVTVEQIASVQRLERIHSMDMLSMIVNAHCSNSPCCGAIPQLVYLKTILTALQ